MPLLGILPFLMLIGLASILKQRGWTRSIRDSLVLAGINTAVWALAGAELLSFFHALAFWPLLIWWGAPVGLLVWFCSRGPRLTLPDRTRDPILLTTIAVTALLLAFTFVSGILAVPSNWDALSYHLPRQVYWMQQQHVGFFSTGHARMLTMPPLAEYIGVQLMILAGGDYWVHSIQWVAYALSAAAVSMIARDLGLNARFQALTALLVVTIPPAALQASNAKNDLVTAFFLCALSFLAFQLVLREKLSLSLVWHLGACGGLLLLSKGTGMLFGFPLAIWILCALLAKHGWRQTFRTAAVATALAALLSAPFLFRTYISSESPLKQNKRNYQTALRNQTFTPQAFVSNVLRNTAMHIATDSPRINPLLTAAVAALHRCIGIDLNDPRTTYAPSPPYQTELGLRQEDFAKAPVHVLLGIVAFFPLATRLIRHNCSNQDRLISSFLLMPFLAFFTFCFLLSWQVWHSRLHIPVLCILCPSIVFAIGPRFPRTLLAACAMAAALGLYSTLCNASKPLVGKSSIITHARKRSKMQPAGGLEAAKAVATVCRSLRPKLIGLQAQPNYCEYTLLRTVLSELDHDPHFIKLDVGWRTPAPTEPDLVVTWYIPQDKISINVTNYSLVLSTNSVRVYVPQKPGAESKAVLCPAVACRGTNALSEWEHAFVAYRARVLRRVHSIHNQLATNSASWP